MYSTLDVIAVISNPVRYASRYRLYKRFEAEMLATEGVRLTTVETAFGDRPHVVTEAGNPRHVQLRTSSPQWNKEEMINVGISRLPGDWQYVCWADADVSFTRPDWPYETVQQLQHHEIVQGFTHCADMGPDQEIFAVHMGYGYGYKQRKPVNHGGGYGEFFHPGYVWSARRSFIEQVAGLLDRSLCGASDHLMAVCITEDRVAIPDEVAQNCPGFARLVNEWREKARGCRANMGYVPTSIVHHWHGKKRDRKYIERWSIITDNKYDPYTDLIRDWQGLYTLNPDKPKLRDDLNMYMAQRNEDSIDLS